MNLLHIKRYNFSVHKKVCTTKTVRLDFFLIANRNLEFFKYICFFLLSLKLASKITNYISETEIFPEEKEQQKSSVLYKGTQLPLHLPILLDSNTFREENFFPSFLKELSSLCVQFSERHQQIIN